MLYDLLIRDAFVIDGSDAPGYRADVAIMMDASCASVHCLTPLQLKKSMPTAWCWHPDSSTCTPTTTPW